MPPLRELAAAQGIRFGTAVDPVPLAPDARYREVLAREFDMGTPENHMKWGLVHPDRDRYDVAAADAVVDALEADGSAVRGHTLAWNMQNPQWLLDGGYDRTELEAILADHIATVAGRYRGRLAHWDVVNEAIAPLGGPTPSVWRDGIGFPEYVDLAFRLAAEADPEAELYYNDYGMELSDARFAEVERLVAGMVERGVPIDGVGFQAHLPSGGCDAACVNSLLSKFLRLDDLGLRVSITELDVFQVLPETPQSRALQASMYRGVTEACLLAPNCDAIVVWGFDDTHSWIPGFIPGAGAATLFDAGYQPRPAYDAVAATLAEPPVAPSCSGFSSQAAAQAALDAGGLGAPLLDVDGDGVACEELAAAGPTSSVTTTSTTAAAATSATPRFTG